MKIFMFFLSFSVIFCFYTPVFAEAETYRAGTEPLFIVDAGHGGADGGAVGVDGTYEKDLNLDLSLKLAELFYLADIDFVLTRDTDDDTDGDPESFVKRSDILARAECAEKYPSAVFIMIHMNSSTGVNDKGFQVFYGHLSEKSEDIAKTVYEAVSSSGLATRMREVKKAPSTVYLTKNIANPALLVECGFISNADDCALLTDGVYRQKLALVLFSAFCDISCESARSGDR